MNEADARRAANAHRPRTHIPATATDGAAQQRYIELVAGDREQPAPVRDVLAWVVRFHYGVAWGDVAVDDKTGDFLRVEYSRSGQLPLTLSLSRKGRGDPLGSGVLTPSPLAGDECMDARGRASPGAIAEGWGEG